MAKFWPFGKKKHSLGRVSSLQLNLGDELPQYQTLSPISGSARRPAGGPFVREYEVAVVKGATVENAATRATVILNCDAASSGSADPPRFFGQSPISGSVELVVRDPLVVDRVGLSIQGRFTNATLGESYVFFDSPHTIWDRQLGDPRLNTPSTSGGRAASPLATRSSSVKRDASNLHGSRTNLPPSYEVDGINGKVEYQLCLTVYHGQGLVQSIASLDIPFLYTPKALPLTPPPYKPQSQSSLVTSPLEEPKAWGTFPTIQIQGSLLRRDIIIQAEFFLGEPLRYRTGSFIPCYAVLEASDWRSLDIIATTETMSMSLLQKTSYAIQESTQNPQQGNISVHRRPREGEVIDVCGRAAWTVPQFVPERAKTRQFYGEIRIPRDLEPTCNSDVLSISYAIQFGSFNCSSFEQSSPRPNELKTWAIEITNDGSDSTTGVGVPSVIHAPNPPERVRLRDIQGGTNDFSNFSF